MPHTGGQHLELMVHGARHTVALPLPGRFQADNALVAAALAQAVGIVGALDRVSSLTGVRGRMELAAHLPNGAAVYVDYAHTPDALERLLAALRPHTTGRLHVVFGAGGDRDRGKRPLMGDAAHRLADAAIVTDDNPRSEAPAAIRAAILAACPGATEIGDRAAAIAAGLNALAPGDVLVVAGKGHESGQTIGGVTTPVRRCSRGAPARRCRMTALPVMAGLDPAIHAVDVRQRSPLQHRASAGSGSAGWTAWVPGSSPGMTGAGSA